jgi:hypothetical protein
MASRKSPFGNVSVQFRLFLAPHLAEGRIPEHEVAGDQGGLDRLLPLLVKVAARAPGLRAVRIVTLDAIRLHPRQCLVVFLLVVDAIPHAAGEFGQVNGLHAHTQVGLEERLVHDRAGDTHGTAAHGKIGLAAHHGCRQTGLCKPQDLLRDIGRDRAVAAVLDIAAIDPERGQPLLGVAREHGRQVNGTGPLGPVESPDGLRAARIHVHGFRPVAPAGRYGQRNADILPFELLRAGRRLGDTADAGVGDHARHGRAIRVLEILADEGRGILRHGHHLAFKRFAHAAVATVNGRADAYFRERGDPGRGPFNGHMYSPPMFRLWRQCLHRGLSGSTGIRPAIRIMAVAPPECRLKPELHTGYREFLGS